MGRRMMPMFYIVKSGDSLSGIATRFRISVMEIMEANVICNPNLIFPGQPLIIPEPGVELPKAGGFPYYVVQFGDSLWCLSNQFSQSIGSLSASNQIPDPNQIFVGRELLVRFDQPNPFELFNQWNQTGLESCGEMSSLQIHGIYYIGTFRWESLGERAVPYLLPLLRHSCDTVRYYTVLSLGRIGTGTSTRLALQQALRDSETSVVELARLALQRFQLVQTWTKRIHITISEQVLFNQPNSNSASISVPKGTPVIGLRWNIPSPTAEEGPLGDIQIYDLVQLPETGQTGYFPRVGYNAILIM